MSAVVVARPVYVTVVLVPPTSAPMVPVIVKGPENACEVVATDWYADAPPYRICPTGAVVVPVPPLPYATVPESEMVGDAPTAKPEPVTLMLVPLVKEEVATDESALVPLPYMS